MLEIEVCEVRGRCPVYRVGDRITIEGPRIVLEKTDALCIHASQLFFITPLLLIMERTP